MAAIASPSAPTVFVSYSHDTPGHMDKVLALCDRLRHDGVDTNLDQYEPAPPEGWPRWTVRQIEKAEYVLVVCTEVYRRRFDGTEEKGRGLGVKWEGAVLNQVLYDSESESDKLVPVTLTEQDEAHIPTILRGVARYHLGTSKGYEQLYRHLTRQSAVPKPALGALVPLVPKPRLSIFPEIRAQADVGMPAQKPMTDQVIKTVNRGHWNRSLALLVLTSILAPIGLVYWPDIHDRLTQARIEHEVSQFLTSEMDRPSARAAMRDVLAFRAPEIRRFDPSRNTRYRTILPNIKISGFVYDFAVIEVNQRISQVPNKLTLCQVFSTSQSPISSEVEAAVGAMQIALDTECLASRVAKVLAQREDYRGPAIEGKVLCEGRIWAGKRERLTKAQIATLQTRNSSKRYPILLRTYSALADDLVP